MNRYTISDLADIFSVEKENARGFVKFLEDLGEVEDVGARAPANGRGRAERVYRFNEGFEGRVAEVLQAARLNG